MASFLSKLFSKPDAPDENGKKEQYYITNPNGMNLTEQQWFGISLGLVIGEQNGAYIDSLDVGKTDYPQHQMMQRNWGIQNREDALYFLESRAQSGHRHLYNRLLEIYMAQDCVDAEYIDFAGTEFESKPDTDPEENDSLDWTDVIGFLENLDEVYELEDANAWFGDMEEDLRVGTDAWDFGRIVFVARVCYTLGYITESEAWHFIDRMAQMARQKFNNWEDYATSYMLGRAMWGGADDWEEVARFAADAIDNKNSPWTRLKW